MLWCCFSSEIFTTFCQKIFMSVPEEREQHEASEWCPSYAERWVNIMYLLEMFTLINSRFDLTKQVGSLRTNVVFAGNGPGNLAQKPFPALFVSDVSWRLHERCHLTGSRVSNTALESSFNLLQWPKTCKFIAQRDKGKLFILSSHFNTLYKKIKRICYS